MRAVVPYPRDHGLALARALRDAVEIDPRASNVIPSTKGTL